MFRHILVAHGSRTPNQSLSQGLKLADQYRAKVTVVHVIPRHDITVGGLDLVAVSVATSTEYGSEIREAILARLDVEKVLGATCLVREPELGMTVGRTVAHTAASVGADLIVAGSRSGGWRLFRNDTVMELLRHANLPVLVASQ
ncbi:MULTISPECIES: universal stress protein [Paraburkholderia]|uniref:universal stress protein n=1 Tax=Paraburkholderia TaxID=1822464 RepID=UPI00225002D1|nr:MULTISPECIES: universal stress protein [Paraburkholderia]MCX4159639.1 universal stress protein [Paraburkholderia aspalathi]MDN7169037.1 universal stress protein [Paraburkholderia sp. SECH2]MDQ6397524.1 universal stress protein [Paraburkholderia aspalathi]